MNSGYIRLSQAGQYTGVSSKTIRRWIKRGMIKAYAPTARCILVKQVDLDSALQRFEIGGQA